MSDITRRSVLTAAVATGTAALAGCSSNDGGSGDSDLITNVDVVEKEDPYTRLVLVVDLVDDHGIDKLALQDSEGSVVTDGGVDPAQTRVELSLADMNIIPDTYEIIAYAGNSVTGRTDWTPNVGIDITGAEIVYNHTLSVELNAVGDIPVTATDAYLTEGYVIEDDQAGRISRTTEITPFSDRNTISVEGEEGFALLTPPNGGCNSSEQQLAGTIEFEARDSLNFEVNITIGEEDDISPIGESCSGTTVENISKV